MWLLSISLSLCEIINFQYWLVFIFNYWCGIQYLFFLLLCWIFDSSFSFSYIYMCVCVYVWRFLSFMFFFLSLMLIFSLFYVSWTLMGYSYLPAESSTSASGCSGVLPHVFSSTMVSCPFSSFDAFFCFWYLLLMFQYVICVK